MTAWLHWIGAAYYTIDSFIDEASRMGVSRRVPQRDLKKMEWGDKVYCVTRQKGKKNPVIFAYFIVETIYGIQTKDLPPDIGSKIHYIDDPRTLQVEKRGCGYLKPGGLYATTTAKIEELAEYSDEPQVQGGLKILPEPWPILWGMPPFRGFRPFDEEQFIKDVGASLGRPRLRSLYYA
jgi:hypothetical protein